MKVITVKQPWASLIALGYKEYEFRTWSTKYRGPLLIHAGKGIDKQAMEHFKDLDLEYPTSQIVASVNLDDCCLIDEQFNQDLTAKNTKVYGMTNRVGTYAWYLSNVKRIDDNEYVKGQLGLWNIKNLY
ncbi:MAG: ASCH domain-containing protein [Bacilli bacterium]